MRALSPNLHSLLGTLTLSLSILLMAACTSDYRPPEEPPEINTFNAYINNVDNSINYFNVKNNTLSTFKIANFEPAIEGYQNTLFLDTNEDVQGYEYIAYVTKNSQNANSIKLFDLDKAENGKQYSLVTNHNGHLCGISATPTPADNHLQTKHAPEVILQLSATADCMSPIYYEKVDFSTLLEEEPESTNFNSVFVSESVANSVLVGSSSRYGYLNYNTTTFELSFRYVEQADTRDEESNSWSTILSSGPSLTFSQVSDSHVLFQLDNNLHVISIDRLFTIDDSDPSSSTPVQSRIDNLLATPTLTLSSLDTAITSNSTLQQDSFAIKANNTIYMYQNDTFNEVYKDDSSIDDETSITFLLNNTDELLILNQKSSEFDVLTSVSSSGNASTLMEAEEISILMNDDKFYANTLNLTPQSGKQAHVFDKVNNNLKATTFDNSTLINIYDMTQSSTFPVLISSEPEKNVSGTRQLPGMYLYKFDENRENGRALAKSSRENENGNVERRNVDFSYGTFDQLLDINFLDGTIINDNYGFLSFWATYSFEGIEQEANFIFAFDPSQETPDPDIDDQSLSLLLINGN